ncbi:MAG: DUF4293 family protein [Flavobacteriaceae bacterium]
MIQRIQTLYLLTYILLAGFCFWRFPELDSFQEKPVEMSYGVLILIVFSLVGIGLFKRRKQQMRIVQLTLFFHLAYLVTYLSLFVVTLPNTLEEYIASVFFGLGALFLFLALRGIKKDEALVRSLDRLR